MTPAGIPLRYVADAKQRIELYRKLAEVMDEEDVNKLKGELRDRFGPLPTAVELLLQVSVLKVLASQRDISVIETSASGTGTSRGRRRSVGSPTLMK